MKIFEEDSYFKGQKSFFLFAFFFLVKFQLLGSFALYYCWYWLDAIGVKRGITLRPLVITDRINQMFCHSDFANEIDYWFSISASFILKVLLLSCFFCLTTFERNQHGGNWKHRCKVPALNGYEDNMVSYFKLVLCMFEILSPNIQLSYNHLDNLWH